MENTQVEELGRSSTNHFQSAIISLLRDYHLSWKMDRIIIYIVSRSQGR